MARTYRQQEGTQGSSTPGELAAGTPTFPIDHSFTLQTVMELQKTTAQLVTSIDHLTTQLEKQSGKLSGVEEKLSGVTHKIYAAGVVLTILVAVGGFVVSKAWDMMFQVVKPAIAQQQSSAPPPSSNQPPPR